jgi:hypothetical protein
MDQKILKNYEKKGLPCPFVVSKSGDVEVSETGVATKKQLSQMGTVIFETIGAIGDVKIDGIEIQGSDKGLLIGLSQNHLVGSLFDQTKDIEIGDLRKLLEEFKTKPKVAVEERKEAPAKKEKVKLESEILDQMKDVTKEYLGDFAERIFKNQLKAQRVKADELYDEDARRFIFALGKAAGMIIGPSKGQDMTNKLLELLK